KRRGVPCIFFVITDLIDNQVIFRESVAALCIDKVMKLPVEQVEAAVRELGIGLKPPPKKPLFTPMWVPLEMAVFEHEPDPRLKPLLHWLLTISPADTTKMEQLCARLGVDAKAYLQTTKPYL